MKPLENIAFVINAQKLSAAVLGQQLEQYCQDAGVAYRSTTDYPLKPGFLQGVDACCVLGGDGTLLSAVPEALAHSVPVFGINHGKLGFLAVFTEDEAKRDFKKILGGDYRLVERSVLECRSSSGQSSLALNDVVIKSPNTFGLIGLRVRCDGDLVTDYRADGLIFSTSTGSTAYNLSAGGPVVHPRADVITMTPICPHTLTNRSMVFPHSSVLSVGCVSKGASPLITLDGDEAFENDDLPLTIRRADHTLTLLQPTDYSHFRILRGKLMWGGEEDFDPSL